MQATRVIAIRHGETAWNVATRIQGQLDVPLNANGLWQAQRMAASLVGEGIDCIYASDLLRAYETAQALSAVSQCKVLTDEGLREREFGVFQGKTFAEIDSLWPEQARRWRQRDPEFAPEGGESLVVFRDRVLSTVQRLLRQHPDQQVALVSHGGVMDVLYRAATGQALDAPRTWELGNAAINRLLWATPAADAAHSSGLSLVGWSDTRHLEEGQRDEATA